MALETATQQIQTAQHTVKTIAMRQGAGIIEIGLTDFSPNQSIDCKWHQGNHQKGPPNPRVFNLLYEYLREQEKEEQHYEQLSLWK